MQLDTELQYYGEIIDWNPPQLQIKGSWSRALLKIFTEECSIELSYVKIWRVFIVYLNFVYLVICNIFNVDFFVLGFVLAGNEYMFYLVADTLASGNGGVPNPSVETRSCVAGAVAGGVSKPRKVARATTAGVILSLPFPRPQGGSVFTIESNVQVCLL